MRHTPFLISLRGIDILLCGSVIPAWVISVFAMLRRLKSSLSRKSGTQDDVWEVRESLIRQGHTIFDLQTLRVATRDFHRDNKLGEGALGVVYKGRTDEREIAVKKLWMVMSRQVMKQLTNGLKFMGKIRHRNILKLLGCCAQGAEILLVYEYLPNGSLDAILFGPGKSTELDWQKRHNIITGIARGLVYLHHDSHLRIVHRDIKATNILLDDKLNPKIGGFGLAKLFPEAETHLQTRIAGTRGYMAPESMQGQLSVKVDVYSFGVLLLEIVSGRKNIDFNQPEGTEYLVEWVKAFLELPSNLNLPFNQFSASKCKDDNNFAILCTGMEITQAGTRSGNDRPDINGKVPAGTSLEMHSGWSVVYRRRSGKPSRNVKRDIDDIRQFCGVTKSGGACSCECYRQPCFHLSSS